MNASVGNESNGQRNLAPAKSFAALVFLLCLSRESGMKYHIDATSQSWLNRFPDPHNNDVVLTGLAAIDNGFCNCTVVVRRFVWRGAPRFAVVVVVIRHYQVGRPRFSG